MSEKSKTKYVDFTGKAFWAKVYKPDEFMGVTRWTLNLYLDEANLKLYKELGIQKKIKEDENGKFFPAQRLTQKLINGKMVHFTPPIIRDKNGEFLVSYVDEEGKIVRSFDDPNKVIKRVGEPFNIGNGSLVKARMSVYPTLKGPGNRLEELTVLDLIEYKEAAPEEETPKGVGVEVKW